MNNKKHTGKDTPDKKYMQTKNYYKTHPCRESFTCSVCKTSVSPSGAGTNHRNHCPNCLCSIHLDISPGDRNSQCGGVMEPISVWVRSDGEWAVIHRCRKCGALHSNRIAADDNPLKLLSIALKPLAYPPFPIELIEEMIRFLKPERGRLF